MIYYITSGGYDDYQVLGVYEGPPGLDLTSLIAEFKATQPHSGTCPAWRSIPASRYWNDDAFIAWLVDRVGMKKLEAIEIHLPHIQESVDGK